MAASERALGPLLATAVAQRLADRVGQRRDDRSARDVRACSSTRRSTGVLVGAGDPPSADERRALGELAALVAAVAGRRPELTVILAGGMAEHLAAFGDVGGAPRRGRPRPGAPSAAARRGPLADLLIDLALPPADARRALGAGAAPWPRSSTGGSTSSRSATTPATRVSAVPGVGGGASSFDLAVVPTAGLAPAEPDDAVIDRVGQWSTWGADRHRLRDRMRELRIAPWSDATGEGVSLRMAAARAALGRLAEWTPEWANRPAADLVVATGGAWAVAPAPTVALALADVLRRPGAGQFALDHARILAPLGSIPDADERRAMILDLVDDLLAPLGTFVTPAGLRPGRSAGLGGRPRRGRRLDRARPHARRPRPRRPAARHVRRWPSSSSATGSGSARAAGISRST